MIAEDSLCKVGRIKKPHGYKGDLSVDIFYEKEIFTDQATPFFVKIDNISVPFFVETIRGGDSGRAFIKFKDVNSDEDASEFSKKDLYALKTFVSEVTGIEEEELDFDNSEFIGYEVTDAQTGETIGCVEDILEGKEYDYLSVRKEKDGTLLDIPAIEEFIEEITTNSTGKGEIKVTLPEGFLEI